MPDPVLMILTIVFAIFAMMFFIVSHIKDGLRSFLIGLLLFAMFGGCLSWVLISYGNIERRIVDTYTPTLIEGSQYIYVKGEAYNITKLFGKNFPESVQIKLEREENWSCGVNWMIVHSFITPVEDGKPVSETIRLYR